MTLKNKIHFGFFAAVEKEQKEERKEEGKKKEKKRNKLVEKVGNFRERN